MVLEKTLESPLDNKEIKLINPEKINSVFTDEAEAPIVWPLIGKDPDAGKDWGKQEKGVTEDVLVGWYHRLNGHEFEQTLGNSERQEAWHAALHRVPKNGTGFSDWTVI